MTTHDTPSGLRIGLLYFRPMPEIYGDMLALQTALLDKRVPTAWMRIINSVYRWL